MQNSHSRQLKSFSMVFFSSCFCLTVCQSKKRRYYINWVETIIMPHCLMKLAFGVCVCVISGEVRRGFEIHSSSFLSGLRSTMACSSSAVYLLKCEIRYFDRPLMANFNPSLTLKDFEDRKQNGKRIVCPPFCGWYFCRSSSADRVTISRSSFWACSCGCPNGEPLRPDRTA